MKKIIIINKTNSSDHMIFKLLDLYYDYKDKTIMFNNYLYTIEKKTTMLKTKIIVK